MTLIGLAAGLTAGGIFSDRVGLGPGGRRRITTTRALGVAMALGAVALTASAKPSGKFDALVIAELVGGGFATACQQGVNGRLGRLAGNAIVAAMISFAVGTVALVALTAGTVRHYFWSAPWWLYLGGLLAAIFVVVSASVVGRLGVLRVMLGTVGGQLSGGVLLDAVAPPAGVRLTAATVAGAAIAIIAVGLAGAGADSPRAKIDPARASVPAQGLGGPS